MLKIKNLKSYNIITLSKLIKSINKTVQAIENKKTVKLHIVKNSFSYDVYKINDSVTVAIL